MLHRGRSNASSRSCRPINPPDDRSIFTSGSSRRIAVENLPPRGSGNLLGKSCEQSSPRRPASRASRKTPVRQYNLAARRTCHGLLSFQKGPPPRITSLSRLRVMILRLRRTLVRCICRSRIFVDIADHFHLLAHNPRLSPGRSPLHLPISASRSKNPTTMYGMIRDLYPILVPLPSVSARRLAPPSPPRSELLCSRGLVIVLCCEIRYYLVPISNAGLPQKQMAQMLAEI